MRIIDPMDAYSACLSRFENEVEYLGNDKLVNTITPLVSVSVTAYRHKNFISQCLDGILTQQTNFPFEIIVGEDGSDDGTKDICISYAEKYRDKIRLFLRNRTTSQYYDYKGKFICMFNGQWNRMSARGKYIALCEGDDYWTDNLKLQKQIDFLEANPGYVMCYHDALIEDENGVLISKSVCPDQYKRDYDSGDIIRCRTCIPTLTLCYRNVLKDLPPERHRVLNGDDFLTSLLGHYGHGKFMENIKAAVYRKHPGGIWSMISESEKHIAHITTWFWLNAYYQRMDQPEYAFAFTMKISKLTKTMNRTGPHGISFPNRCLLLIDFFLYKILARLKTSLSRFHINRNA